MSNLNETRIVLGSLRYKSSPNTDFGVKLPLEQSEQQYIEYDRNLNVDLAQVFDDERQLSTTIRPSTKITFIGNSEFLRIIDTPKTIAVHGFF
jgi:gamma-glutamyl:cysteine ligase YbdK (ATP-grasp superfamily)